MRGVLDLSLVQELCAIPHDGTHVNRLHWGRLSRTKTVLLPEEAPSGGGRSLWYPVGADAMRFRANPCNVLVMMDVFSRNEFLLEKQWVLDGRQMTGACCRNTHESRLDESSLVAARNGWLVRDNGMVGRVRIGYCR